MSAPVYDEPRPEHPHVVRRNGRRNLRWSIETELDGPCALGPRTIVSAESGNLYGTASRAATLKALTTKARRTGESACVVWGPEDCTWIDERGRMTDGNHPPRGEIADNHLLEHHDVVLEDVWTVKLPAGCTTSHLCIRRIDAVVVEITPGEPFVLGSFFDLPKGGRHDPSAAMMSRGRLKPPARFRGQPVTGVRDHWQVVGPVQPSGDGVFLRDPWPEEVRRACERIAGGPLPDRVHRAAWRALNPHDATINHVGVLEAA